MGHHGHEGVVGLGGDGDDLCAQFSDDSGYLGERAVRRRGLGG